MPTDYTMNMEEWDAAWAHAERWRCIVLQRALAVIEGMEDELDAADWCHPGGAAWVRVWLNDARDAADVGDMDEVNRLVCNARRKLDQEWWWWSRGGSLGDVPPERPAHEHRWACRWLAVDTEQVQPCS